MTDTSVRNRRATAAVVVAGSTVLNLAFLGLAAVFDYPAVLDRPAAEVLASFREHQGAVIGWFLVLAVGAALLAPIAVMVGRLGRSQALRLSVGVGIAAATVQVVGLLRWPLLVPSPAGQAADPSTSAAAEATFRTLNQVLGATIGETLGYSLTAVWTVLVAIGLGRSLAGRWFQIAGLASAVLIATGVLIPLDVPGTDLTNFAGYVVWSLWLLAMATVLIRGSRTSAGSPRRNAEGFDSADQPAHQPAESPIPSAIGTGAETP